MKRIAKECLRILILLSLASLSLASVLRAGPDSEAQRFSVAAKRFSFQPQEITVQDGKPVILELTSDDVTHGLKCNELGFNVAVHKGHPVEVTFTPHQAGHFVARCSHFCGMGHGSMTLIINVVDK